ncbi:MAG: hypothetical protein ACTSVI_12060 [Promethearchaeota archaeon]
MGELYNIELTNNLIEEVYKAQKSKDSNKLHKIADLLELLIPDTLDHLIIKAQVFEKEEKWEDALNFWREIFDKLWEHHDILYFLFEHDVENIPNKEDFNELHTALHVLYCHYKLQDDPEKIDDVIDRDYPNDDDKDVYIHKFNINFKITSEDLVAIVRDPMAFPDGEDFHKWLFESFPEVFPLY